MAFIPVNQVKAEKKANGKGEITINHLLGANELGGNDMFAKVVIPPGCSIGYHEHHGNTETYHILQERLSTVIMARKARLELVLLPSVQMVRDIALRTAALRIWCLLP